MSVTVLLQKRITD